MNHTLNHWLQSAILFLAVALLPCRAGAETGQAPHSAQSLLIVGIDADYAPLEYVDDLGIPHGYDVEFTNLLMKRLGRKFTYAPNTWENIAGDVLHGRVDLGMMIYSPYRKDSTNYSRAVFRLYYQVVFRKSDDATFNFRNLQGKHIAYMKSRPVGNMLRDENAVGHQVTNLNKAILDLADGKYDAVICFRYQARYFITHHNLSNLKAEDLSLQPREYCYVSHSKQLIDEINTELKRMEDEGIIDDIYGKDIKAQFGSIEIPQWVWPVLVSLVVIFLLVLVFVFHHSNKKLEAEHQKLVLANEQLAEKNNALVTANERAEESSRMKTAFIQQISHEIRTPLNVLNGFTQVLTTSGLQLSEEEKSDIGQRINENTERITNLVNKMLELSDANSQTVIERSDNVTAQQIALLAASTSGINQATHITFSMHTTPTAEKQTLQTNLQQTARALSLLLDNAQKFSKEGEVRLRVEPSADAKSMVFSIEDTGIGIPAEQAEHIFEAFLQLDDYYDGTGIGLTVSRSIARRLGGDVVLDTSYRPGARFVMTLPISEKQNQ